jgi:hypothetical protein
MNPSKIELPISMTKPILRKIIRMSSKHISAEWSQLPREMAVQICRLVFSTNTVRTNIQPKAKPHMLACLIGGEYIHKNQCENELHHTTYEHTVAVLYAKKHRNALLTLRDHIISTVHCNQFVTNNPWRWGETLDIVATQR